MKKKNLLYLVHRLPYPPNKGDKIASYHQFIQLKKVYQVYLGCFIDDPDDWQYQETVQAMCADSCILALHSKQAKIKSLTGLLTNKALSLPYYKSSQMQAWVNMVLKEKKIEAIVVFSSPMAQYIDKNALNQTKTLLDLVDVDSDKWRLYAQKKSFPMRQVYQRESKKLLQFERKMAQAFDATLLVSREEANLFKTLAPESASSIHYRVQGVDAHFFSPETALDNPYSNENKVMVFVGAMDYWPNIDAVIWFAQAVFPKILQQAPKTQFYIVGMNPSAEVLALANQQIMVTGRVDDVRAYTKYAHFMVAPLRIARGIQNKVLEAMAMELPLLATPYAIEGIEGCEKVLHAISDDKAELVKMALAFLQQPRQQDKNARECVLAHYDWQTNLKKVTQLLDLPKKNKI